MTTPRPLWTTAFDTASRVTTAGLIGLGFVLSVLDVWTSSGMSVPSGVAVVVLALLRDRPLLPRVWIAAGVSLGGTALWAPIALATSSNGFVGLAELGALGVLLIAFVRELDAQQPLQDWSAGVVLATAILLVPLRATGFGGGTVLFGLFSLSICIMLAIAVGMCLRFVDELREQQTVQTQQAERLEIARDLHDSVAHHVTGIVVRAQAAQMAGDSTQDAAVDALRDIEREGAATLSSMRRIVAALRAEDDDGVVHTEPRRGLSDIRELVANFDAGGTDAVLDVTDAALERPPTEEVVAAVFRIVQEALTNVRTHATAPVNVRVWIDSDQANLHVIVSNLDRGQSDGHPHTGREGFGLIGLAERVQTLGGGFAAGPVAGGGWRVHASIPHYVTQG